jgi:hypothetical protein
MVHGKLEVLLVSAKGLEDTDFLSKHSLIFFRILFFSAGSQKFLPFVLGCSWCSAL